MVFSHKLGQPQKSQAALNQIVISVAVTSGDQPLGGAMIFLVVRDHATGQQHVHETIADSSGVGQVAYAPDEEEPVYVSAMSGAGTWYGASQHWTESIKIECPPLEFSKPLGWWHECVGIKTYNPDRGRGIKVGLIDTGVGPHPYLSHVEDQGAIIDGVHQHSGADVSYHGTMMAGLIGARPTNELHPAGVAPGVSLSSVRVYPADGHGAKADDVAAAIRFLAEDIGVDLINLSLSSGTPSDTQEAAIAAARSAGAFCIAAAGNTGEAPVGYPAALPGVAAVGAAGRNVAGPTLESNAVFEPVDSDRKALSGEYLSTISSYGQLLACIAPGTAIASTVPSAKGKPLYASQVGSSDAVAIVTGALAAHLGTDSQYLALARGETRADYASQALDAMCRSLGLAKQFQGLGIPTIQA